MQTYFDNAATSHPKPTLVFDAMQAYQMDCGASPGRGSYSRAREATDTLDHCRMLLCKLVNAPHPDRCIFTLNCSDALNLAIIGISNHFLGRREPVHIITTAMAHNSVLRPLQALQSRGVTHTVVEVDSNTGIVDPIDIANAITPHTRLVAVSHGSNVTGTLQDIKAIGEICGDLPFLVDAAQTMGHIPIDVQSMHIDLLAFPGHKGLLGPLGTGGLIIRLGIEEILSPVRFGGTGSKSESPIQPEDVPDKYESGSHNMIGIAGLTASVEWILLQSVNKLYAHEQTLCQHFIEELNQNPSVSIVGPQTSEHRCGVFSLDFGEDPHKVASRLEDCAGVQSRAGLHCAPFAHQTMETADCGGTVRVSFGPFHTLEDVKYLVQSIQNVTERVLL